MPTVALSSTWNQKLITFRVYYQFLLFTQNDVLEIYYETKTKLEDTPQNVCLLGSFSKGIYVANGHTEPWHLKLQHS